METNTPTPSCKETEEETYKRALEKFGYPTEDPFWEEKEFNVAKFYHSERLRLSMPSEEEIEKLFNKHANRIHSSYMTLRLDNFKKAVSQLFNR